MSDLTIRYVNGLATSRANKGSSFSDWWSATIGYFALFWNAFPLAVWPAIAHTPTNSALGDNFKYTGFGGEAYFIAWLFPRLALNDTNTAYSYTWIFIVLGFIPSAIYYLLTFPVQIGLYIWGATTDNTIFTKYIWAPLMGVTFTLPS